MQCPKCFRQHPEAKLQPVRDAAPLGGDPDSMPYRCTRCNGLWLLQAAIPSLEREGILQEMDVPTEVGEEQDRKAGRCPMGHGLLRRAKVDWRDPYYLEKCHVCHGIWFDAGEWHRLSSEHLLGRLDELWSPEWQIRLQENATRENFENDLREKLGEETFGDLEELGRRLAETGHAGQALGYLQEVIRAHRGEQLPED